MKKIVCVILSVLLMAAMSGYSFSRKCEKCLKERERNKKVYIEIGIATRDFGIPIVHKNGKSYATYRCCYGHEFLVDLDK